MSQFEKEDTTKDNITETDSIQVKCLHVCGVGGCRGWLGEVLEIAISCTRSRQAKLMINKVPYLFGYKTGVSPL